MYLQRHSFISLTLHVLVKESAVCGEGKAFYTSIITSMDPQTVLSFPGDSWLYEIDLLSKNILLPKEKKKVQEVEQVIY